MSIRGVAGPVSTACRGVVAFRALGHLGMRPNHLRMAVLVGEYPGPQRMGLQPAGLRRAELRPLALDHIRRKMAAHG